MTVQPTALARAAIAAAVASTLWAGSAWAQGAGAPPAAPATAAQERPAVIAPNGDIADLACSVAKGTICRPGEGCNPAEKLGEEKLPIKITIDFDNRVVMSALARGYISASRISLLARDGDQLMLHGIEHGFAWLISVDEKTRILSMSINSARGAFAGFGDCVAVEELQNKKK